MANKNRRWRGTGGSPSLTLGKACVCLSPRAERAIVRVTTYGSLILSGRFGWQAFLHRGQTHTPVSRTPGFSACGSVRRSTGAETAITSPDTPTSSRMRATFQPRRRHEPSPLAGMARGEDGAGCHGGEASETAGWPSHVLPLRRPRGGTERSDDTHSRGAASAGGGLMATDGEVAIDDCGRARRRSAWSCRRPLGNNSLPLAALSLAALASLVDPATAFQVRGLT